MVGGRVSSVLLAAAFIAAAAAPPAGANVLAVTNANDSGPGSLRAAIAAANASTSTDTIEFSGLATPTIAPLSPLPQITRAGKTIDGTTAPGGRVTLDGSQAGAGADGIAFFGYSAANGAGGVLQGFQIEGFSGSGVVAEGSGVTIQGNRIGTDGTVATPNGIGVELQGVGTLVTGNVISGNTGAGVWFSTSGTSGNTVQGNRIGTDATGAAAVPNGGGGVLGTNSSNSNHVGTGAPGGAGGNLIAGNAAFGIRFTDHSEFNTVQGNTIGRPGLPNPVGIDLGARFNQIGAKDAANLIAGNTGDGILIGADGTTISANLIGTDLAGTGAAPNGGVGIHQTAGTGTQIGNFDVTPVVDHNGGDGLRVDAGAANVLSGSFSHNGGGGIFIAPGASLRFLQNATLVGNAGPGATLQPPATVFNPTIDGNGGGLLVFHSDPGFAAGGGMTNDGAKVTLTVTNATPNAEVDAEVGQGCSSFREFGSNFGSATSDAAGNATITIPLSPAQTGGLRAIVTDTGKGSLLLPTCLTPGTTTDAGGGAVAPCTPVTLTAKKTVESNEAPTTNPITPFEQTDFLSTGLDHYVVSLIGKDNDVTDFFYVVTVTNTGACEARDVLVSDMLPPGFQAEKPPFSAMIASGANVTLGDLTVTLPVDAQRGETPPDALGVIRSLPPGASVRVRVRGHTIPTPDELAAVRRLKGTERFTLGVQHNTATVTAGGGVSLTTNDVVVKPSLDPVIRGVTVHANVISGSSGIGNGLDKAADFLGGDVTIDVAAVEAFLGGGSRAAAAKPKRCRWLATTRATFRRAGCGAPVWLHAKGVGHWRLTLRRRLPRGRYTIYVRAKSRDGVVHVHTIKARV